MCFFIKQKQITFLLIISLLTSCRNVSDAQTINETQGKAETCYNQLKLSVDEFKKVVPFDENSESLKKVKMTDLSDSITSLKEVFNQNCQNTKNIDSNWEREISIFETQISNLESSFNKAKQNIDKTIKIQKNRGFLNDPNEIGNLKAAIIPFISLNISHLENQLFSLNKAIPTNINSTKKAIPTNINSTSPKRNNWLILLTIILFLLPIIFVIYLGIILIKKRRYIQQTFEQVFNQIFNQIQLILPINKSGHKRDEIPMALEQIKQGQEELKSTIETNLNEYSPLSQRNLENNIDSILLAQENLENNLEKIFSKFVNYINEQNYNKQQEKKQDRKQEIFTYKTLKQNQEKLSKEIINKFETLVLTNLESMVENRLTEIEDKYSAEKSWSFQQQNLRWLFQLIYTYNNQQQTFEDNYLNLIPVSESNESIGQRLTKQKKTVLLEKHPRGILWAINEPKSSNWWLIPKVNLILNEYNYETIKIFFECDEASQKEQQITLIRPALLTNPDSKKLQLKAIGALKL